VGLSRPVMGLLYLYLLCIILMVLYRPRSVAVSSLVLLVGLHIAGASR